jgi:hypothetical protein
MFAFLSYVREDAADVLRLKEELELHDIECFVDTESITLGEFWEEKILREIDRCDFFVACFSSHYSKRRTNWMIRELELALERDRRERHDLPWIFPIVLSGDLPVLPRNLKRLKKLHFLSLSPENWYVNLGRLLAAMLHESDVRGAGLRDLAQRYSEAPPNGRITILSNLKTFLDLPEAIALLERGLLDQDEGVRTQAATLMAFAGEEGAKAMARLLSHWSTRDMSFRWSLLVILQAMRGKAACAVPALLQILSDLLSPRYKSDSSIMEYNKAFAAFIIKLIGEIGEPADTIRIALRGIRSDVPEIREALGQTLARVQ